LIKEKVCDYWSDRINNITRYYSSLKYIEGSYTIGKIHPLLSTNRGCSGSQKVGARKIARCHFQKSGANFFEPKLWMIACTWHVQFHV
jgi:hypothetical protein